MELTQQQVKFFHDNGFIRIGDTIESSLVDELHSFIKEQDERKAAQRRAMGLETVGIQIRNVYDASPPLIDRLIRHPKMIGSLASLLGENIVMLKNRHNHAEINRPGDADTRLHRDCLQWTSGLLTAIVYLEETTELNGATLVVPGSQRLPFVDIPYDDDGGGAWMGEYQQYRDLLQQAVVVPMPKGGILLFNGLLFHAAGKNRSTGTRASMVFAFKSVDELIQQPDEARQLLVSGNFIYRGNDGSSDVADMQVNREMSSHDRKKSPNRGDRDSIRNSPAIPPATTMQPPSVSPGSSFNKIVSKFSDDLSTRPYREKTDRMEKLIEDFRARELPLRVDFARPWENAHILLKVEQLFPEPGGQRLLDFGGGNSPTSYLLAERGFDVTVLDVAGATIDVVNRAAKALGLNDRLRALQYGGRLWPLSDDMFECVLSLSVFEGLMPRLRPLFWRELRRVLRPGGSLLMTFDFGPEARFVGDGPSTVEAIEEQIIRASGMDLVGAPLAEPIYDPQHGPPVKLPVDTMDGYDYVIAQYSFGAVHLRNRQTPDRALPSLAPRAPADKSVLDPSRVQQWPTLVRRAIDREMQERLRSARLPGTLNAIGRACVRGPECFLFTIEISSGEAHVRKGSPARPDFTLEMTVEDFIKLFYAGIDFWDLFYSSSLRARGDIRMAMWIADAFAADERL